MIDRPGRQRILRNADRPCYAVTAEAEARQDMALLQTMRDFGYADFQRIEVHDVFFPVWPEDFVIGIFNRQLCAIAKRETRKAEDDSQLNTDMAKKELACSLFRQAHLNRDVE